MRNRAAKPDRDRPVMEPAAVTGHAAIQQLRDWIMAHKLAACRGCNGFLIEDLGLVDLMLSPDSGRSHRQGRADVSGPSFAKR
jgi:hypothetical protein